MIQATATWIAAVQAQFRYQAYLKVNISVVPPGLREGATVTASSTFALTSTQQIMDADRNTRERVATLEHNRWKGDGSFYLPSTVPSQNAKMEWWSDVMPSLEAPVNVHVVFDQAYSIPGIFASWDTETGSYPTGFTITGYNTNGAVIKTVTVTDVTSSEGFIEEPFDDVKAFDFNFTSWSNNWRCRINELVFGLDISINNDRITQAAQDDEVSQLNEKLPTNTKTVTLQNYDKYFDPTLQRGISKYLTQRQRATWQWGLMTRPGAIEWLPQQTAYVDSASVPADSVEAEISFTSRLSFLTQKYRRGTYTGEARTYYDLILDVLQNVNILKAADDETPWVLPESLKRYTTTAPTPVLQANSILQLAAIASGHILYVDPVSDYITFKPTPVATNREIADARSQGDPGVEIAERLRSVKVGIYRYQYSTSRTKAYEVKLSINGLTSLEVEYANGKIFSDMEVNVTGGTIVTSNLYSRGAELKVSGVGEITITITGLELQSTVTYIEYYNNATVASGLDIVVENELITDSDVAQHVAQLATQYYLRRQTYQIPYIIYPELGPMDLVDFSTPYGESSGVIEEHHIDYNGGWTGDVVIHSQEVFNNE